ncbi:MAG: S8 family serine peptidase [Gemmataceae bacterium]|nr:S8 family serine peptidase [Gemmataceae bacterium]
MSLTRTRKSLRKPLRKVHRLALETLEERIALSADMPLLDMGQFAFDPSAYDANSILVRFRDDTVDSIGLVSTILPAADSQTLLPSLPGLQRITLPEGVDVPTALALYQSDPRVLYAEPNYVLRLTVAPNDPGYADMWNLENTGQSGGTPDADIDAERAWDVGTGSSQVVVAVIDTGIDYNHPDLAANIWVNPGEIAGDGQDNDGNGYIDDVHGYDFANNDGNPLDDNGHGTHVAGTIGAVGNNGIGITGVNWNVSIMGVKVFAGDGSADVDEMIAGIYYAAANGAIVSNNSWAATGTFPQALYDAFAAARDAGQIVVAAAGNGDEFGNGFNIDVSPVYPAAFELDNVIAVAATDHTDDLSTFSNFGVVSVDLAAPGESILSTLPDNSYGVFSGTSMATPHVTGVVALVWSLHPSWTYQQVIDQVLGTVDPLPELVGITVTGGRLNVAAAVGNPEPPPPPPPTFPLPILEDFEDGLAQAIAPRSSDWNVSGGRFNVLPAADEDTVAGVSTFNVAGALPANFELQATLNADEGHVEIFGFVLRDYLTNGFLVFDYHSPTDFKFAGADMDGNRWVIGRRTGSSWFTDAFLSQTIDAAIDYDLRLVVTNNQTVALSAGGVLKVSHTYAGGLTDGQLGLGARNSSTWFDNVLLFDTTPPTPGTLPLFESFADGVADHFQQRAGIANVQNGRLQVTPFAGKDGIQTILFADPLPANLQIETVINVNAAGGAFLSNGLVIFDYEGPADFKFAGAYAGIDQWVIGHRGAAGWVVDAFATAPIDALTDYALQVTIEDDAEVTLMANGVFYVAHIYAESLTDGEVGVGTQSAISRFDDVRVESFTPAPSGTLPHADNFNDGVADFFEVRAGAWSVSSGRYAATPAAGQDAISTLSLTNPLPANLDLQATINADAATTGFLSNAFVIFDYQNATDFKFAGAYAGTDEWLIGHRNATGWVTDATATAPIDALTDYRLRVTIESDSTVTLFANGIPRVSFTYAGVLTDGMIGVGTRTALSRFDDVEFKELAAPGAPTPGTLPVSEDFQDGVADHLQLRAGEWAVFGGKFIVAPDVGQDGVSTLLLSHALPANLEVRATINAEDATAQFLSNAFILFDYVGPTDFKFAGAYTGSDQWLIGHRDATGWVTDAFVSAPINASTDYQIRLVVENGTMATLFVNGVPYLAREYTGSLTDGQVGLGTRNAISRFDDFAALEFAPPTLNLPVTENFDDGVADAFQARFGAWTVQNARYAASPLFGQDAISTLGVAGALPDDLEFFATMNADAAGPSTLSNGFIIFDYQGPTNFKFAGAYVGSDQWLIGHRDAAGWVTDAFQSFPIDPATDYNLRLVISNDTDAILFVNGVAQVRHTFAGSLTDGRVGVGTRNAISRFDNVLVRQFTGTATASLPYQENFNDGVADHLLVRQGYFSIANNRFAVTPAAGQDAVATLMLGAPLPNNVDIRAVINVNAAGAGFLSNGVIVFDYVSPTEFKFAGAYAGADQWVIGRRTTTGWVVDALKNAPIDAVTDYSLKLLLENGTKASLYANGVFQASFTYAQSVVDGQVGLGTQNAVARFDDFSVQAIGGPASFGQKTSLPSGQAGLLALRRAPMDLPSLEKHDSRRQQAAVPPARASAGLNHAAVDRVFAALSNDNHDRQTETLSHLSAGRWHQPFAEVEEELFGR